MKRKFLSIILALGVIFSMINPMMTRAVGDGKITVDNPTDGATYTLYRVFDLTYNKDAGAYTYTVTNQTFEKELFEKYPQLKKVDAKENPIKDKEGKIIINVEPLIDKDFSKDIESKKYNYINPYDFSIWLNSIENPETKFVKNKDIKSGTVSWTGLDLGYYMIKSTAGTVVSLTSTDYIANVHEKNIKPELKKTVSGGNVKNEGKLTYADIGEELTFTLSFDVHNHANTEYILKDVLPKGIDVSEDKAISVTINGQDITLYDKTKPQDPIPEGAYPYEISKEFVTGTTDGTKELELKFPVKTIQAIAELIRTENKTVDGTTINTKKTITVTYKGKLNKNAVMSNHSEFKEDNTNRNKAELVYDKHNEIEPLKSEANADVRTTEFQIKKFTMKETGEQALADAKFKIYKSETEVEPLKFVKGNDQIYFYNIDGIVGEKDVIDEITTTDTGIFTIKGLKTGIYWIEESAAPDGFNPLQKRVKLVINADKDIEPTKLVYKATFEDKEESLGDNVVKIENQKGPKLPETGGMGRTIIYVTGAVLFFGALVLLIARKRTKEQRS